MDNLQYPKPANEVKYIANNMVLNGRNFQVGNLIKALKNRCPLTSPDLTLDAASAATGRFLMVNHDVGQLVGATNVAHHYQYDGVGNIKAAGPTGNQNLFDYDALNRLMDQHLSGHAAATTYGYDLNSNRTTKTIDTATVNYGYTEGSNQLASIGSDNLMHNAIGNRTSDNNGQRTFEYNNTNRLFKVYAAGQLVATYHYK